MKKNQKQKRIKILNLLQEKRHKANLLNNTSFHIKSLVFKANKLRSDK